MASIPDYKGTLSMVQSMSKLLVSDNEEDRIIAYTILMDKLGNMDNINRYLFEARVNIVLVNSDKAGLTYNHVAGLDIGICHIDKGHCTYKYIKSSTII